MQLLCTCTLIYCACIIDVCVVLPGQVYYLRALNEVERQRWVTALALAKAKAIKNLESGWPLCSMSCSCKTCCRRIVASHMHVGTTEVHVHVHVQYLYKFK